MPHVLKKVVFKLYFLLALLLPTLLFIDLGIRLAWTPSFFVQGSGPVVPIGGNFWRLILAYCLIGTLLSSRYRRARGAWDLAFKAVLANFGFALIAGIIGFALSRAALEPAKPISDAAKVYLSSYCASLLSIWGKQSEPLINVVIQVVFAPLAIILGEKIAGGLHLYDRLALWSGGLNERAMVVPANPFELMRDGSLRTRSSGSSIARPGENAVIHDSDLPDDVARAVAAKNKEDEERKPREYIV